MEFISNLIKRPISLVLNDTAAEQQQQQSTSSRKSQTPPPIAISNNKFDLANEKQQQQLLQQRNNCVVNNNNQFATYNDKSLNCINNNFKESLRNNTMSTTEANNTAFVVDLGAGGDYEPRNNLLNSSNSNSSNSNSTASTIEELLVQINDNLNQAEIAQHVGDHAASDLLGATSTAHSQLATKSHSSNKLSQTPPRSQVQTPTTPTIFLASLPSPTYIAAGSAVSESTSKDNKLQIDADEESDSLEKNNLSNRKTGVNKINKFIGLTEFDESNIPELPGSLNPNIEEQLKLTFEDNFIPTLTASSIAVLAAASKKENNNKDGTPTKNLQLPVHNETDTAVSSDNELFTECQTFPYVNSAATASLFDTSDMGSEHISEAETFRSALNYNSTTVEEASDDHFNETMENVVDLPYEQNCAQASQAWDDLIASMHEDFSPQNVSMQELAASIPLDENEPMDVDMEVSSEYLQYNMNVTLTSDQVNSSGKAKKTLETTLEEDETLENSLTNNHSMLPLENSKEISVIESKIESEIEHKEEKPVNEVLEIAVETKESAEKEISLLPAKSVDENKSSSVEDNDVLVEKEIKLNSDCENAIATSTAAHGDDNLKQNTNSMTATLTINNLVDEALSASERAVTNSQISSACNKDIKANLALDTNSTCTVSEKKSPQFPLKQKPDNEHFPRSPDDDKQVVFLEKSEYSQNNASSSKTKRNLLNIGLPFVAVSSTLQSNETININDANSSESEVHLMPNNNVNLSTDSTSSLNLMKSPANQHDTTCETNSLASSNVSPHLNETTNICDANSPVSQVHIMPCNTIDSSPATLPIPNTNKLNCTFGAATLPSSSSPQFNETINITDANSPVIDNMNSPAVHSPTSPLNNFDCTFDAKALPSPITTSQNINSKEINALNLCQNAKTKKRYTYNVRETETQEKLNESSEAMDVDEEMQSSDDVPQSLPCSAELHHVNTDFPAEMLSAKEKTTCNSTDEKDIFVENFASPVLDDLFKAPSVLGVAQKQVACDGINNPFQQQQEYTANESFENDHKLFFNASDIDYLYTKGNTTVQTNDNRSSLLLKFDPLVGKPIQLSQPEKQELLLQKILAKNSTCVNSAIEENEEEPTVENQTASSDCCHKERGRKEITKSAESAKLNEEAAEELFETQPELKNNARMSVDVIKDIQIENDCNKTIENSNTQLDEKQSKFNMDDLEKKIKNEVLKTEDIEKKLKEAEQREEALIKRITEKDKSIVKMNSVIEAYEKAIAELISEKEQLIQNYEKQLAEVKIDRDSNYHHLTSLETTFSDLHVKYEKSKEMTTQLKASEESLLAEKKQNLENLRLQEQRYEKMKNHAMQQLEIANRKLETLSKEHSIESTKLKALLKKEEISRASINEQLQQKSRENAELVKICDELINGQGS